MRIQRQFSVSSSTWDVWCEQVWNEKTAATDALLVHISSSAPFPRVAWECSGPLRIAERTEQGRWSTYLGPGARPQLYCIQQCVPQVLGLEKFHGHGLLSHFLPWVDVSGWEKFQVLCWGNCKMGPVCIVSWAVCLQQHKHRELHSLRPQVCWWREVDLSWIGGQPGVHSPRIARTT